MNESTNVTFTVSLTFKFQTDRTEAEARMAEPASGFMVVTNRQDGVILDEVSIEEREADTIEKRAKLIRAWLSVNYPAT